MFFFEIIEISESSVLLFLNEIRNLKSAAESVSKKIEELDTIVK